MITIITENNDIASNKVIEYLITQNVSFKRKNEIDFSEFSLHIQNNMPLEPTVLWHRRRQLNLNPNEIYRKELTAFLKNEETVTNFSFEKINKKSGNTYYIGGIVDESLHEKILDLYLAKECDLKVPDTLITNIKRDLKSFRENHTRIITKPIKNPYIHIEKESIYFTNNTFLVEESYIEQLSDSFAISKFQEYIEKEIEIRVFYFDDSFFAMAIFSQNDEKTQIDFRNYNFGNPNRNIPFKLPKKIITKLKKLLKLKKINTCSIDLILTPDNEFVFLEINPQGQFGWVSANCNYYIEKFIAQKLCDYERITKKRL